MIYNNNDYLRVEKIKYIRGIGPLHGLRKWISIYYTCIKCNVNRIIIENDWIIQYNDNKSQIIFKCQNCGAEDIIHKSWFDWQSYPPIFLEEEV